MALPWSQVESNPQYQALPPDQQDAAKEQYFQQNVAPNVPPEHVDVAKHQFYLDTAKPQPTQSPEDKAMADSVPAAPDWLTPKEGSPLAKAAQSIATGPAPSAISLLRGAKNLMSLKGSEQAQTEDPNEGRINAEGLGVLAGVSAAPEFKNIGDTVDAQMGRAFKEPPAEPPKQDWQSSPNFTGPNGRPVQPSDTLAGVDSQNAPQPTEAQTRAWDILNQTAKEQGISLDDAAAKAREDAKTGLPLVNLDALTPDVEGTPLTTARAFQALTRAAVQRPGPGSAVAAQLASRGNNIRDYLNNFIDKHFSTNDMYGTLEEANEGMNNARPAYEAAMEQKPVWNDRIQQFLQDPDVKDGIKSGMRLQRLEALARGEAPYQYDKSVIDFNEAGDPVIGNVPNMHLIDAAKKGLDAKIEAAQGNRQFAGRATSEERALAGVKTAFLKEVDAVNPQYAAARQAYADPASMAHATEMGRNYSKMDPEEIQQWFSDPETTEAPKAAFKDGVRYDIGDRLRELNDKNNGLSSFWNQGERERLAPMMQGGNQQDFEGLSTGINHLRNMADNNLVLKGSPTYESTKYGELIDQDPGNKLTTALKYITNPKVALARDAAAYMSDHLYKKAANMSSETAAELMKVLASKDPDQLAAVSLWGKHNGY